MSQFVEVKTAELVGAALDWAVAMAEGWKSDRPQDGQVRKVGVCRLVGPRTAQSPLSPDWFYSPSTDWAHGGQLVDKYKPWVSPPVNDPDPEQQYGWDAEIYDEAGFDVIGRAIGCPSAMVAICRAVVAAKLGGVVQIPAELVAREENI